MEERCCAYNPDAECRLSKSIPRKCKYMFVVYDEEMGFLIELCRWYEKRDLEDGV
ncbi:hypothetical protein SAMN02745215_05060 [Desulfitobacterium chlororespirans DSM 11544]|uniref:Uncharacterized protein n=1 Tax=Desulfitobacterium chlororespirans DSM 11544 TaxID=1121395 RepID=A0A1M7UYD2_9FIRM|nr:hypothetical protein SAMN02745215_05060 [Desulfitobacterium chlororespirans DSM 11544]